MHSDTFTLVVGPRRSGSTIDRSVQAVCSTDITKPVIAQNNNNKKDVARLCDAQEFMTDRIVLLNTLNLYNDLQIRAVSH